MHTHIKVIAMDHSVNRQRLFLTVMFAIAAYLLFIDPVFAQAATNSQVGTVVCDVAGIVLGNLGRGLATIAIMTVGVGAAIGRVTWATAVTVAVGISIIFGATTLAPELGATSSC